MALFKYYPPKRADMLIGPRVRFSPATEFNDPFDGVPVLQNFDGPNITRTRYEDIVRRAYQREISVRPCPLTSADFQRDFLTFEKFVETQRRSMPKYVAQFYESYEKVREIGGILSLCRNGMSAAMWAHYAENQTGFLVELDDSHDFFQQFKKDEAGGWVDVKYDERRPVFDYEKEEAEDVLGMKSPEWAYEHEVRLVRLLDKPPLGEPDSTGQRTLFPLPPAALVSITLGANTSAETQARLDQALKSSTMSHVQRCRAVIDHTSYKVLRAPGW